MKSSILAVTIAAFASMPLLTGCAEEYDAREAAYPQPPIGYTQPGESQAAQQAAQEAAAAQAAQAQAAAAPQDGAQGDVAIGTTQDEYSDTDPAALTDFKPTLDPYGTWAEDPQYGTVWVPSTSVVGADFSPYVTAGHWAYDDDYVWVSDYSWGWAPFHYGRWVYIGGRGWGWIPGRTYAGAWVSWRVGYDGYGYVGWAPLPPLWYWRGGYAYGIGVVPYAPYAFCGHEHLFSPSVGGHVVTGSQVPVVAGHTRPYVPANPTPGHTGASPKVNGPPPSSMRIPDNQIVRSPTGAAATGLAQARAYSKPSTAQPLGAHPPAQSFARNAPPSGTANGARPGYAPSRPGTSSPPVAQNHARPGYAPPSGYRPSVTPQPHVTPRYTPPAYSPPSAHYSPPSYSPPSSHYSPPSYSPPSHYSGPSYSPPASHYSGPSTHYSPPATHSAPPSYHAPSPPSGGGGSHSAPSHSYGGGGGGGYRGGGGSSRGGGGRR